MTATSSSLYFTAHSPQSVISLRSTHSPQLLAKIRAIFAGKSNNNG